MIKIAGLYEDLVEMGHSEAWSKKKVELVKIDNDMDALGIRIDKCNDSEIKSEMQFQYEAMQDIRERIYQELCNTKDND